MPLLSRVPWARSSARAGVGVALAIVASVALAFASLPAAAAPLADPTEGVVTAMIVAYAPGVSPEDPNGNATGDEVLAADEPRLVPGAYLGFGFYRVDLSRPVTEAAARSIAAELAQFAKVTSAEPDLVMTAAATQDPVPAWGLDRIDQRSLPISDSYTYSTTGAGVTAYVVDSGIRASHVEVAGRVRNGVDEVLDGNGTDDCNGHGTHVAGTLAGETFGVAKEAELVPVRVLGCSGSGTASALISGLQWVVADHDEGVPAVLNLSLGFGAVLTSVDSVVKSVVADGITVVIASGNAGTDACRSSPGGVPEAITVNATGDVGSTGVEAASDARASFSNYGECTDIYAPGVQIRSAWSDSDVATSTVSGTSAAAPHVAGAAARVLEAHPDYSPAQVWAVLASAATPIPESGLASDPAWLVFTGSSSVSAADAAPEALTSVRAVSGDGSLRVSWSEPADGGSPITGYSAILFSELNGGNVVGLPCTTEALTCTFDGLTNGATYFAAVTASNDVGTSPASSPRAAGIPIAPTTRPSAPQGVLATAGNARARVTWVAPSSDGGSDLTGFVARAWSSASGARHPSAPARRPARTAGPAHSSASSTAQRTSSTWSR
ncbi:MAG: S8 family serine peptidase [Actinobacteria bacterium]|nr:S8 family serine peptidase [Actinomycetota bacterium]